MASKSRPKTSRSSAQFNAPNPSPERGPAAYRGRFGAPATATVSSVDVGIADAFIWHTKSGAVNPVAGVNRIPLRLRKGIKRQADQLVSNTRNHADGFPANNALLWGARGCGKISLVKAVQEYFSVGRKGEKRLALVEIHREDIQSLSHLLSRLRGSGR